MSMKNPHQSMTDTEARQKIHDLIKDIRIATLVTQGLDGKMHARPMGTQNPRSDSTLNGDIWFMTYADSAKVAEIEAHADVLLSYAKPGDNAYLTLRGTAEIVRDHDLVKEFWHEPFYSFFPKGPDDPNILLIHVRANEAEFWDSPASVLFYAYGYAHAKITGKTAEVGDHERVKLN